MIWSHTRNAKTGTKISVLIHEKTNEDVLNPKICRHWWINLVGSVRLLSRKRNTVVHFSGSLKCWDRVHRVLVEPSQVMSVDFRLLPVELDDI